MPTLIINGQEVNDITLNGTDVKQISDGVNVLWEQRTLIASPLRVVNNVAGSQITFNMTRHGSPADINLEYSTDNVNWNTWTETNGVRSMSIAQGGNLYLRGENPNGIQQETTYDVDYYSFSADKGYAMVGDIRSLISRYETDTVPDHCFTNLFKDSTTLNNVSYVRMPSTVVGNNAYRQMFMGCTALTKSPHELPAVDAVSESNPDGYYATRMFSGCTSLTTMPIIRMTRFGRQSCYEMFKGCTALVNQWTSTDPNVSTTQNISFTIAADNGQAETFVGMFQNCTSLVNASGITATKTTEWHSGVFYNMFYGCTALTSAPSITFGSFASGTSHCKQMFYNCTSLVSTPNIHLDATTVYQQTYKNMYRGCTKLTTAPEIKATTMFADTNNGSLVGMFYGCTALTYIKVNFTDWNSGNYTTQWTYNVGKSGNFGVFSCPPSLARKMNSANGTTTSAYVPYGFVMDNSTLSGANALKPQNVRIYRTSGGYLYFVATFYYNGSNVQSSTNYYAYYAKLSTSEGYSTFPNWATSTNNDSHKASDNYMRIYNVSSIDDGTYFNARITAVYNNTTYHFEYRGICHHSTW